VRNLTEFGAFVELEPGVDGLVHVSDMAWTRRVSHPSEVVQKGQEVEAVIIGMDVQNQRISLSIKELLPNEWDQFATDHQVGDEVDGFVTNVTDFGLFVELAPGVEGLCHISEVERRGNQPLSAGFERNQVVRTRLIRIDWNEKRIGLSLRGITQPEAAEKPEVAEQPEATPAVEPEVVATEPATVTAEPEGVTAEPEGVAAEPEGVAAEPETVTAEPETVATEPETVATEPETVTAGGESVTAESEVETPTAPEGGEKPPTE
jgi:small subunit ribosomal protein S1